MVSRRQFLRTLAAGGAIGLAGCSGPPLPPDEQNNTSQPNQEFTQDFTEIQPDVLPDARPSMDECSGLTATQHPVLVNMANISYGDDGVWELRITRTEIPKGEVFGIRLQNTSSESKMANLKHMYNMQTYTTNGWQEIRWMNSQVTYEDAQYELGPNESYIWQFYSTDDGLIAEHPQNDKLLVCPSVQPGRYRFVFTDPVIGVQFNISE